MHRGFGADHGVGSPRRELAKHTAIEAVHFERFFLRIEQPRVRNALTSVDRVACLDDLRPRRLAGREPRKPKSGTQRDSCIREGVRYDALPTPARQVRYELVWPWTKRSSCSNKNTHPPGHPRPSRKGSKLAKQLPCGVRMLWNGPWRNPELAIDDLRREPSRHREKRRFDGRIIARDWTGSFSRHKQTLAQTLGPMLPSHRPHTRTAVQTRTALLGACECPRLTLRPQRSRESIIMTAAERARC